MIIDAAEIEQPKTIHTDVAIFGAGITGLALADRLTKKGISCSIFESGDLTKSEFHDSLNKGQKTTYDHKGRSKVDHSYQQRARERFIGGGCNHWGGSCTLLGDNDFKKRDWVPDSGWPINRNAISRYYSEVSNFLGIPDWQNVEYKPELIQFKRNSMVRNTVKHRTPLTGFKLHEKALKIAAKVEHTYINSTAYSIQRKGEDVDSVSILCTTTKSKFSVKANRYVLALGGIENPRLLLDSLDANGIGLGNEHDCVGRYFSDHIVFMGELGKFLNTQNQTSMELYDYPQFTEALFTLDPTQQKQYQLSNSYFGLSKAYDSNRSIIVNPYSLLGDGVANNQFWDIRIYVAEQFPNRESRVKLSTDLNKLGIHKAQVDWRLKPEDYYSFYKSIERFAIGMGHSHNGRVSIEADPEQYLNRIRGAPHTLGTTRMGSDKSSSVVDRNCKVHSSSNLYIAGGSTFPTIGFAHPTINMLALAYRLADYIQDT